MSGKSEGQKELATNRLLEVLRGNETATVEESSLIDIGLSEEEEKALLASGSELPQEISTKSKPLKKTHPFSLISLNKDSLQSSVKKIRQWFLGEKQGVIGLDIGSFGVTFVKIINKGETGELIDYGMVSFPRPIEGKTLSPEEKADFLYRLLGPAATRNFALSTSVFGPQTSIRHIILPKVGKNEMRDAVIWNAKKDLPFPIENSLIGFEIVRELLEKGVQKLSIVAALAERPVIDSHLDFLKLAEMQPSNIVAVPLAIFQAFSAYAEREGIKDAIIIDLGASTSYIIFVGDGQLQFAREISMGGNDITEGMMGSISTASGVVKIDWEEAERLKKEYGIPPEDAFSVTPGGISLPQIGSIMKPVLERLLTQIQRSIDYYRSKFSLGEPEHIYLSGGTALMKNIVPFFTDGLNKEVHLLNPLQLFTVSEELKQRGGDLSKVSPAYTVACGLAVGIKKGVNLLPPEIQALEQVSFHKRILVITAVFVNLLLTILTINVQSKVSKFENELHRISSGGGASSTILKEYDSLTKARDDVRNQIVSFQNHLKESVSVINVNQILKLLSNITPDYITINTVEIRNDAIKIIEMKGTVHGGVANQEVLVAQYSILLEESKYFTRIRPYDVGNSNESNGELSFTITCEL